MSNKPIRHWKVSIKEVSGAVLNTEMHGHYEIEDVREHFGCQEPDVLWYRIEEIKPDARC